MKKLFISSICLFQFITSHSQSKISWLGIDFTHVKIIGQFYDNVENVNVANKKYDVQRKYFSAWNQLLIVEEEKYDIRKAIRRKDMVFDMDTIMKLNAKPKLEEFVAYDVPPIFTRDSIQKFIYQDSLPSKEGTGVLMIAEYLNKAKEDAYFHFVVIDMNSSKVLVTDRFKGQAGGFGMRNYWGNAIYEVIKAIKRKNYKL